MMNLRWWLMGLGMAVLSSAVDGAELATRESPRATDLLRAEKLAEQAEKRLRLPAKHGPGWQRGGGGWESGEPAAPAGGGPVTIRVQQPNRKRVRSE